MWQLQVSSHYLSGTLPYVRCHITVDKMCQIEKTLVILLDVQSIV